MTLDQFCAHLKAELNLSILPHGSEALEDLGIDSLLVNELILVLEDMGVPIPNDYDWASSTVALIHSDYLQRP